MERMVFHMQGNPTPERHFGAEVAGRIKAKGLTLREVADGADIPLSTLHRRLGAESMSFTLGELSRIALLLNTTAGAIVTEYEAAA